MSQLEPTRSLRHFGRLFATPTLAHAQTFDRCVGRLQSVTDWLDGNTIKMQTGRKRKRMAEGTLFSVCRNCNGNVISNNHPLDFFGEKAIREGIVRD